MSAGDGNLRTSKELLEKAYFSCESQASRYSKQCFVIEYSRLTEFGVAIPSKRVFPFANEAEFKEQIGGYLNHIALKTYRNFRVEFSPEFLQSDIGQTLYLTGEMVIKHMSDTGMCASYLSGKMPTGISSALSVLYSLQ